MLSLLRFVIDLSPAAASIDGDVFPMLLGRFNVIDLPESEDLVLLRRQAQELMRSFPVEYWREKDRNVPDRAEAPFFGGYDLSLIHI